jgi:hypothetical protein
MMHRISTLGAATRTMLASERATTMVRAAVHEIGCSLYDLRDSEIAEVEAIVTRWIAIEVTQ